MSHDQQTQEKFAIRFGLGAIKAVGFSAMENAVKERENNGKFADIYDFAARLDPRSINKKSIEALAKAGAFDSLQKNRRQVAESFDILASYATEKSNEANSNQMSLFGALPEANLKPELKKFDDWSKAQRLGKEFEAFGFFLNEHPLDENISDLKKRGVIFVSKLENDELEDGHLVKMAGVIAASKHRSGSRGRFAYLTISDPFGIFEAMIFDEALITSARDILVDGSAVALECLIRKDEGGVRILVREVRKLDDFIKNTKPAAKDFEDIKKQVMRQRNRDSYGDNGSKAQAPAPSPVIEKKIFPQVEIKIKNRAPLLPIKALLSQCLAASNAEKYSKVFISVVGKEKISKIELAQKYSLGDLDAAMLRKVEGILGVEVSE
jgi:DNA polymerase III alpha subunit